MRIACIGGGPAGLVFAISMKLRDAAHDVTVFERNEPGDTFGWGVVFSDQTMDNLRANDPKSAAEIEAASAGQSTAGCDDAWVGAARSACQRSRRGERAGLPPFAFGQL